MEAVPLEWEEKRRNNRGKCICLMKRQGKKCLESRAMSIERDLSRVVKRNGRKGRV